MKIYDVSVPIKNNMLVWPGDSGVEIKTLATVKKDGIGESRFSFGSHTGTHIDAPSHFLDTDLSIDKISPEKLIGDCRVVDLTNLGRQEILVEDISLLSIKKGERILFKTGNSSLLFKKKFPKNYVYLSLEGAKFLADKKINLVGTDFLGIEKKGNPNHPTHKVLLSAGIVLVEGLDLREVSGGSYKIFCLPLRVEGADGSPARVILIKE